MKKTKLLSIIIAIATSICMVFGTFSVYAEETETRLYTLEELFAMNDEEFLALENAETYYESIKKDVETVRTGSDDLVYCGISGTLIMNLYRENSKYQANVTEKKITELLGDTVNYLIDSPVSNRYDGEALYYPYYVFVHFDDYCLHANETEISNDDIIEFAKCWYCVDQAIPMNYLPIGNVLDSSSGDKIISGDVNLDKSINILDAIWISKALIGEFELTEAQQKIGDINSDGKCNIIDAIEISKTLF